MIETHHFRNFGKRLPRRVAMSCWHPDARERQWTSYRPLPHPLTTGTRWSTQTQSAVTH